MATLLRGFATLCVVVGITFVFLPSPSSADDYAECNVPGEYMCAPANAMHKWCFTDSIMGANRQGLRDAFDGAMQRLADVTDMSQDQIPNSQCTSAFDVTVHMANIGLTTFGAFSCKQNPLPPQVCDFGRIELNPDAMTFCQNLNGCGESDGIEEAGEYDLAREKTSCHEVGHSVGLDHHTLTSSFYVDFPNDCLVQGWLEAHRQDAGWRRYNAHHINHVDNWLANH